MGELVLALEPRHLFAAGFDLIGLTALRNDPIFAGIDGSGVSVAVIDTGVDFSHPLLASSFVAGADIANGGSTPTPVDPHGTHVAGIVGARNTEVGVAPGVGLIGLQVFSKTSGGQVAAFDTDTEAALQWVLDHRQEFNIVAVNMSLGSGNYTSEGQADSSILFDEVKRLEQAGVTVISAAGNSYGRLQTPGSAAPAIFSTLAVGAVWEENEGPYQTNGARDRTTGSDRITVFSQRPSTPNNVIFAPGAYIRSTIPNNQFAEYPGTSMASPMVAGVVALMQEAALQFGGRLLSPTEVRDIIQDTADIINDGDDEDTTAQTTGLNYPRVDAYAAVQRVRTLLSGANGGGPPVDVDPNGTLVNAVVVPALTGESAVSLAGVVGVDGATNVGGDDVDLYRFDVTAPGVVTIAASGTDGLNPFLRIFNSAGVQIAFDDDSGAGNSAALSLTLDAGTYYAGVSASGNSTYNPTIAGSGPDAGTGAFNINFSLASSDPNGILSGAIPISIGSGLAPQVLGGSIGSDFGTPVGVSDVDIFRIVVPDDGTLFVDIDTPSASGFVDSYLRIFDENGQELVASDDDRATDLGNQFIEFNGAGGTHTDGTGAFVGHQTDSFIGGGVFRGDVYYVAVSSFDNQNYNPNTLAGRINTGTGGTYDLIVTFANRDVNGSIPQAATTIPLPVEGVIGVIGEDPAPGTGAPVDVGDRDVDFIRVNSPTAGVLEVDIDSYSVAGLNDKVDTELRLFDATGKLLALNDDDGTSLDPLIRFQIAANTNYFVAVTGHGNGNFDPFVLGSGAPGDVGEFRFSARVRPLTDVQVLSNDTSGGGTVANLSLGGQVRGNIGEDEGFTRGAADVDLFRFTPTFSAPFQIRVTPEGDFATDPFLRVFDADTGQEIAKDDNGLGSNRGSFLEVPLVAGKTYLIGVSGAGPNADDYNPITGVGAGPGTTGDYSISLGSSLRSIEFDAFTPAVYTDANGDVVVISLKGPGNGIVFFESDDNADASHVLLENTTSKTKATVTGDTTLGAVFVMGDIKMFDARNADIVGDSEFGAVPKLLIRSLTNADLEIGAGLPVALSLGQATDSSITSASQFKSIIGFGWADTDATADVITAPFIKNLTFGGDFAAHVAVEEFGKGKIGGVFNGAEVRSAGSIAGLTVGSTAGSTVFAGVANAESNLPDAAGDFINVLSVIRQFVVKSKAVGAFADTRVAAATVQRATLGSVDTSNASASHGVAGLVLRTVTGITDVGGAFSVRNIADPSQSLVAGDAELRVV